MAELRIRFSYIPAGCGVARAVKIAIEAYESGLGLKEARIKLLTEISGSFGAQRVDAPTPDNLPLGSWVYVAITWGFGIIDGYADTNTFCPDQRITRAEAVKLVVKTVEKMY